MSSIRANSMARGRSGKRLLLIAWFLLATAQPALAVTVVLKNGETLRGYPVLENDSRLVLKIPAADGTLSERTILKSEVDLVHHPVDFDRLSSLQPDRPKAYRDYAEELAEKRIDPEARDTSLRLYVLAAYLDPDNLGRSSLLGMTALATNAEEERRIRAMAYLLDPEHDRNLLRLAAAKPAGPPTQQDSSRGLRKTMLVRALEMLRQGNHAEANALIRRPEIGDLLNEYSEYLSYEEFLELCADRARSGPAAPPQLTRRILRVELELLAEPETLRELGEAAGSESWSVTPRGADRRQARPLTLDSLTPFDPRLSIFRDGRWVAPE